MFGEKRWAFVAGLLLMGSRMVCAEELPWKKASFDDGASRVKRTAADSAPQKMPVVATESTATPLPEDTRPEFAPGTDCRDGNCTPKAGIRGKNRDCLKRTGQWLFYRQQSSGCTIHPTAYQPPLYAWFPCKPGQCDSRAACKQPCAERSVPGSPSIAPEPPLPQPVVPRITRDDKPLIPGSSSVLAVLPEPKLLAYPYPTNTNATPYHQVQATTEKKEK